MQYRYLLILEAILVIVIITLALCGISTGWIIAAGIFSLLTLVFLFISISNPLRVVSNGISLLRGQDYASRLRHVGQPDADRIVDFFNSLMYCLKAERLKLKEQNHFLQQIMTASPMGIAVCDYDGNVIDSNNAFKTLATDSVMECLKSLKSGESVVLREASLPILRCSRLHFMDSGFARPFFLVERMTDEIISAEKQMMNKVVRTMSHEVNNTLGSVISVLESLAEIHSGEDTALTDVIQASRMSCLNLAEFVHEYSSVVKLPTPTINEIELNSFINGIMPQLRQLTANRSHIELSYQPNDIASYVAIDTMLIERVVMNVVKNSVESIDKDENGKIIIATSQRRITVTDNGRGLTPEAAQSVFTPFFSTKHPDRGLGLMLVADILRSHGATFSLTTDPDSNLTTFSITFQ